MALAATGNFSRAAEERHMTQPAFSRRIRALEEWLGADLFDRSSQPARVTEVGEWFRTVAQDLQSRVAGIPGEARAISEASSTTLRFAATHALSFTFMPRWLHALEAHASMGQLQLMSDVQQKCETLLAQNQVHFMLAHGHPGVRGPLDEADYPSIVVGTDQLIPVSAPDDGGRPLHGLPAASKGSQLQWLGYSAESGLGRILKQLRGPTLDRMHAHQVLTAHLASVLRTMALDKRGCAWLPKLLVEDDLAIGRLVSAAPDDWRIDLQIRLYRQRGESGKAAETFWQAASAAAQPV
ncbi:LysR substrate-binding domain-containing protein [Pelomonas sp. PFR6]|uniref:LysR substrate-binding domain-containing protein n=1 Tax=Roseateles violae TaxID=3058042 RepID=A0ABT8DVD7_9BURK|nr:LysR substrate-binding domain-containing protein [Pelomonas sp. PFR6]MDN3920342.1 LysR substrate-binding domain-containing protein [Pelomonas sp. PFR6]